MVIGTAPHRAVATVDQCIDLGIRHVWLHRSGGQGNVSQEATTPGREHGILVIDGGCPLMFDPTADRGHKVMCALLKLSGNVPRTVS